MLKRKIFFVTFLAFVSLFLYVSTNFAIQVNKNEITDWKVSITSDTKDIKDTQEISFIVKDNPNVVNGKIAPGGKATANIEIDVTKTKYPVEILAKIDDSNLFDNFNITAKLNEKIYNIGEEVTLKLGNNTSFNEKNGKNILSLNLEWEGNDQIDTYIGTTLETLKVPVTIEVKQHI